MFAVPYYGSMIVVGTYDPRLVILSFVAAVMASYTALDLAGRVTASTGRTRMLWLVGGAASMGLGIWSMHFIAMLAFRLPMPMPYHVPTVLLSLLVHCDGCSDYAGAGEAARQSGVEIRGYPERSGAGCKLLYGSE